MHRRGQAGLPGTGRRRGDGTHHRPFPDFLTLIFLGLSRSF
jgi:hypothetical protein